MIHYLSNFRDRNCNSSLCIIILKALKSSSNFPITLNNEPIYDILQVSVIVISPFCFGFFVSGKS